MAMLKHSREASSGIGNFLRFGVVSFGDDEYLDVGLVDAPLPTA